jgi:hypothetical protein
MVKQFNSFDDLSLNRKKWFESSQDNGFDQGLRKLLTELYPDTAHFIYELLQNAEDAQATSVSFILHNDSLEFIHNGSRLFDLKDIDAITSIANSTKPRDNHSIGKYGVGFKAVFTYTSTPYIHSGEWNFKISHMVIPEKIAPTENVDRGKTYFKFPFDNPKKSKENAQREIEHGLTKLPLETLLFLNNIKEVNWNINGICQSIRKKEENNIVWLSTGNDADAKKRYLRFSKNNIKITTSNGETKSVSVSLAYKLAKEQDAYKIIPIEANDRTVFVYFPAEKENSKLRFLINAPFDSEISRASIRDTEDNRLLIDELVKLQLESMEFLRDNAYLTTEFLRVLPNSKDELSEPYCEFHKQLVNLFNTQAFTPTLSGEFAPADSLFRGESMYKNGPHISEFISDKDLALLIEHSDWAKDYHYDICPPLWLKNPQQQNSFSDFFLKDLDVNSLGNEKLISFLCENFQMDQSKIWTGILQNRTRDLYKFYLMQHNVGMWNYPDQIKDLKLFACTDKKIYSFNDGVYLAPDDMPLTDDATVCHILDPQSLGRTIDTKNKVTDFLKKELGVEKFSQKAICREIFKKYAVAELTTEDINIYQHMRDIKFLVSVYKKDPNIIDELRDTPFILDGDGVYHPAQEMYLDRRFEAPYDDMKYVAEILSLSPVSLEYKDKKGLKAEEIKTFISILKALNIKSLLWKIESPCQKNPQYLEKLYDWNRKVTNKCKDEDYDIEGLDKIVERQDILKQASKLIWMSLFADNNEFDTNSIQASYRANAQAPYKTCSSKYIYTLTRSAWIINKQGQLCKPADISFDDLPDDWKRPEEGYDNHILKAINFGKATLQQKVQEDNHNAIAKSAGFANAQEMEKCKQFYQIFKDSGKSLEDTIEFFSPSKSCLMPESHSANPQSREAKIKESYAVASEQTSVTTTRSVKSYSAKPAAAHYLKEEYTNEDGVMCCQMCQQEMPFKKKDGTYYFETTQIFKDMKKDVPQQYLALCPNCAAEYNEWVKCDLEKAEELRACIENRLIDNNEGQVNIDLYIHQQAKTLYFTGKHYCDLSKVVRLDGEIEDDAVSAVSLVNCNIKKGDYVHSESFGDGLVLCIAGNNADVQFSNSIKKIALSYLQKKTVNVG